MDHEEFMTQHGKTQMSSATDVDGPSLSDLVHALPGGGAFNEAAVKRDKGGKFAKKEAMLSELDALWDKKGNLIDLAYLLLGDHEDDIKQMMYEVAAKYGIEVDDPNAGKKNTPAWHAAMELRDRTVSFLNTVAKTEGVSPSGTRRMQVSIDKNGSIQAKSIPHAGPNPHPEVTRDLLKAKREVTRLNERSSSNSGGIFNPDAQLDTSRVHDTTDSDYKRSSSGTSSWLQKLFHTIDTAKEVHVLTTLDEFLAHYGIKGMRWGVRRKDPSGSDGPAGAGSTDKPAETLHVSADVERFIRTHQKAGVEMSDREIKEAVQRANLVKQYNDVFAPDGNKELRAKVEALALKAKMTELTKKPTALERVDKLIASSSKGFEAFDKLNKATGGDLQKKLAFTFDMSQAGILARSLATHDKSFDSRKNAVTAISASTKSSLSKSADLRRQVDELLRVGTDGSVQLDLLDL